ncbi:MAG: hypothetical protein EZS28_009834 [Streblomastix strix]|uniref:Uncharacterized protein n=1 Tax=Streblomastix strix TaxID=222440 RepID=A0A5J4WII2_9EUKA|nr:MAG: hypothetical protein EZS28_009834 [Streblomastix strix]
MTKESAHFILSEHQLIRVIAHTFEVVENQVVLNTKDEECCGKFMHDGTITLSDVTTNNVNILTLDIDKVNLLRYSYKLSLQKVRKITSTLDLGDISSKLISPLIDVLIKHDEALFGSIRYNSIGLVEQVENNSNQINMVNNAPAADVYSRSEPNEIFDTKVDKTDTYKKTETDEKLNFKANKTELIDAYTKFEDDALLLLKANVADIVYSYSKTEDDALLLLKANKTELINSYIKSEDDALLLLKADKSDSYIKSEDDALLLLKADKTERIDSYTKSEDEAFLLLKAHITELIDSYFKTEDDALLLLKVNVTDLINNVDLTSAQTVTGQKQFGVISVSSISKLNKNDASIFLTNIGYMLVSSIVVQPQLQEIRDITTGKSKAYAFSTQTELNDWIAVQDNVAKLVIGDNLYISDKEVTDYWWDKIDLKVPETELPDITNVITTLSAATGGGNAITDISIDGNVLTPAKNKNFVDTNYDQSISGQKTFKTTINSVGIIVQTYDNSGVVCARVGVRSNEYIQSTSYSKSEDDALLLLKADKTQLIDLHTKGETINLLNNKADTGVSYTKGEDDALLLLKTDKSITYTKTDDDALLLLKADKTQLIDSCTKGETNNLLNNKADTGVSYSKIETNNLLDNRREL